MKVTTAKRLFVYDKRVLIDPNHHLTLEQVKNYFCIIFPELKTRELDDGEIMEDKVIYTFI
jgi:PRTRC genetic system protein C